MAYTLLPFSYWSVLSEARAAESRLCRGPEVGASSGVWGPGLQSLGLEGGLARAGLEKSPCSGRKGPLSPWRALLMPQEGF